MGCFAPRAYCAGIQESPDPDQVLHTAEPMVKDEEYRYSVNDSISGNGMVKYLVKWEGLPARKHRTWKPIEHFDSDGTREISKTKCRQAHSTKDHETVGQKDCWIMRLLDHGTVAAAWYVTSVRPWQPNTTNSVNSWSVGPAMLYSCSIVIMSPSLVVLHVILDI